MGVCWSTKENPTIDDNGITLHQSDTGDGWRTETEIVDLTPSTTYYVRSYAYRKNGEGKVDDVSYGKEESFTTGNYTTSVGEPGTFTDPRDGRIYKTVKIGNQTWFAENLKANKLNDGTNIPNLIDFESWSFTTNPAYCVYKHDPAKYFDIFGHIYNWEAIETGKLAPKGWHVATKEDWKVLSDYLEPTVASNKLRTKGSEHWEGANTTATNETGFSAYPCQFRVRSSSNVGSYQYNNDKEHQFLDNFVSGHYWTATMGGENYDPPNSVWIVTLVNVEKGTNIPFPFGKPQNTTKGAMAVRCVKD
jgi:uncharacterized protein (TIGR02145 family)